MTESLPSEGTFAQLRAAAALMRHYKSRAALLLFGFVVHAVTSSAGIWLIFPLLVSMVGSADAPNLSGFVERMLSGVQAMFPGRSSSLILMSLLLAVSVFNATLAVLLRRGAAVFQWTARGDWAVALMARYLHEDHVGLSDRRVGDELDKLFLQSRQAALCLREILAGLANFANLFGLFVLLFLLHWPIAAALLISAICLGAVTRPIWQQLSQRLGTEQIRLHKDCAHVATENLLGVRDIQAFGIEAPRLRKLSRSFDRSRHLLVRHETIQGIYQPASTVLLVASMGLLFVSTRWLVPENPGLVVPVIGFGFVVIRQLLSLTSTATQHMVKVTYLLPAVSLMHREARVRGESRLAQRHWQRPARPAVAQDIVVSDLSFGYPGKDLLFDHASFTIPGAKTTAIIGPSGCGKSTLADLLVGFLPPSSGTIVWGGIDASGVTAQAWRMNLAYVSQESFMFNASIRENVQIGAPDARDSAIIEACRQARAWDFVERLPDGLDTVVGDRGFLLSGGERQRLAIARALIRDASILILDEAANAVDRRNAELLWQAIGDLRADRTILIISHHVEKLGPVDHMLTIRDGSLVEASLSDLSELSVLEDGRDQLPRVSGGT